MILKEGESWDAYKAKWHSSRERDQGLRVQPRIFFRLIRDVRDEQLQIGARKSGNEFARLAQAGTGHPVTVRRIDDLGARRIARLDFAGTPIAALVPETLGIQGSEAGVVFDTAHLHVYANGALVEGEAIA